MQLINKLFGRPGAPSKAETSQFQESEDAEGSSRNGPRRELVQVVVRDSMRRHGIPSAWIECRILSVASRSTRAKGMHLQLIVRDGTERLLTYVPAFQASFMGEIARFDPRHAEWLFSVSWQFRNMPRLANRDMPDPAVWATSCAAPLAPQGAVRNPEAAAQQAPAFSLPSAPADLQAGSDSAFAETADGAGQASDDDVLEDLQALYAIRDASLRSVGAGPTAALAAGPAGERDFESTHPGGEATPAGSSKPRRW